MQTATSTLESNRKKVRNHNQTALNSEQWGLATWMIMLQLFNNTTNQKDRAVAEANRQLLQMQKQKDNREYKFKKR